MISVIHYISAIRRLKEVNKTVKMLGNDHTVPVQIFAQRDFIQHELDYYKEESKKFMYTFIGTCAIIWITYITYSIVRS